MANQKRYGICHLCGFHRQLTFEHVPPEAAFNGQKVLLSDIQKVLAGDMLKELHNPTGKTQRRGAGAYTLCDFCNNNTGSWYGPAYVNFAKQLFPYCRMRPDRVVSLQCTIKPLNVYKQILVMFCSASSPSVTQKNPALVRYLLNRESRHAGQERVFLGLYDVTNSKASRQAGITGRIDGQGRTQVFSEISFPPFSLVLSAVGGSPDPSLFEITSFKNFELGQISRVSLTLRNLAVNSVFPADYRTVEEIERQAAIPREAG